MNRTDLEDKLTFYISTGLSGMIVIPTLYIMTVAFAVCAVFLIGYAVASLFISLPGGVNIGTTVLTGIPAFIVTVIVGGLLFILAAVSRKYLKKYLAFISNRYKKLHMEQ